jgi:hypothetical protein
MGLLGKFLDRLCDERPDLAQQLIDREIGPLGQVFGEYRGAPRTQCACVVGTVALAAGFQVQHGVDYDAHGVWWYNYLGEALGWDPDWLDRVSMQVYDVANRLANGPDWRERLSTDRVGRCSEWATPTSFAEWLTVHLVRQRIALRLAMRQAVTR